MKYFLIVAKGRRKGLAIPINRDVFRIGSGLNCQLRCKDPSIPAGLCALVTRGPTLSVRDLRSGRAVLINSIPLSAGEEWALHPGDALEVGPLRFTLETRDTSLSRRDLDERALGGLEQTGLPTFVPHQSSSDSYGDLEPLTASRAAAAVLDRLASKRTDAGRPLTISQDRGAAVVRFNVDELVESADLAQVRRELQDNLHRPNQRVLLDCKNVHTLSNAAASFLGDFASWLVARRSSLALCRVRPEVREVLKRLDLHTRLPMFADKPSALSTRW
jgi:anti-anti-sigma regulatory factor